MRIIRNEKTVFCDIDETLIHHIQQSLIGHKDEILVPDTIRGGNIKVLKNNNNIRLLEEEHFRGSHIVVWSRGGWQWAEAVINALDLASKVDDIMTKPLVYIDDKDVSEWLPYRIYLKPDEVYKK